MNPFDETVPTLTIQYRFEAYLNFRIDDNFKLFIEDDSIDTTFTKLTPYFRTKTKLESLNWRAKLLTPMAVSYLNLMLKNGVDLPVNKRYTNCVKEPRIRTYDHYLFADAEPDFEKCAKKFDQESSSQDVIKFLQN